MNKIIFSLSALFLFGTAFAGIQADSIYLDRIATEKLHSVEQYITRTPLTDRIAEDELAGGYWINPLRNIQRMIRSIPAGKADKTVEFLNLYIHRVLVELNTTGKIAVYGTTRWSMRYFTNQPEFYFGGVK